MLIHVYPNGSSACPICGYITTGDPPYAETQPLDRFGMPVGRAFATASHDICPSCNVEYGFDDHVELNRPGASQSSKWDTLRNEWLAKIEVDDRIRRQLLNIEVAI